jgi:hypothetical protein
MVWIPVLDSNGQRVASEAEWDPASIVEHAQLQAAWGTPAYYAARPESVGAGDWVWSSGVEFPAAPPKIRDAVGQGGATGEWKPPHGATATWERPSTGAPVAEETSPWPLMAGLAFLAVMFWPKKGRR